MSIWFQKISFFSSLLNIHIFHMWWASLNVRFKLGQTSWTSKLLKSVNFWLVFKNKKMGHFVFYTNVGRTYRLVLSTVLIAFCICIWLRLLCYNNFSFFIIIFCLSACIRFLKVISNYSTGPLLACSVTFTLLLRPRRPTKYCDHRVYVPVGCQSVCTFVCSHICSFLLGQQYDILCTPGFVATSCFHIMNHKKLVGSHKVLTYSVGGLCWLCCRIQQPPPFYGRHLEDFVGAKFYCP